MRPIELRMQAFGSYADETIIDFSKVSQNLFLVTGDTGAGKTTIFDAIVFALYGQASSGANKKEGVILQSQFAEIDKEPFVELTFSEMIGGTSQIFKVKRIPKHIRPAKKKTAKGDGTTEENGSVSLIMPDGTEYPSKETDAKIEMIVGLTKAQFMQVGMIAQGEFMELLRAKSDDKKLIFRKLFDTGIFDQIIYELAERKKNAEKEIAVIKTECQTEARHVEVPPYYTNMEGMNELITNISDGKLSYMNEFIRELEKLCNVTDEKTEEAHKEYEMAGKVRDDRRAALSSAENLLKMFAQKDNALKQLQECESRKNQIEEYIEINKKICDAYEIKPFFERLDDSKKDIENIAVNLKKQQELLPEIEASITDISANEKLEKRELDEQVENFNKVCERVEKARKVFADILHTTREFECKQTDYKIAESNVKKVTDSIDAYEKQVAAWKKDAESCSNAEKELALWENRKNEADVICDEMKSLSGVAEGVKTQLTERNKASLVYLDARQRYIEKEAEYKEMRNTFYDEQAGILAAELEEGKPCPVCGSIEHPQPHMRKEEHKNLTRDMVDNEFEVLCTLGKKQDAASGKAKEMTVRLNEKVSAYQELLTKFVARLQKNAFDIDEYQKLFYALEYDYVLTEKDIAAMTAPDILGKMQDSVKVYYNSVKEDGNKLKQDAERYRNIQKQLSGADDNLEKLRNNEKTAFKNQADAKVEMEAVVTKLKVLEESKEYENEALADKAYNDALEVKSKKQKDYNAINNQLQKAVKSQSSTKTLIDNYKNELPKKQLHSKKLEEEYNVLLKSKNLSETEWKSISEKYDRSYSEVLSDSIENYNRQKSSAENMLKASKDAIGDQEKPDIDSLKIQVDEADSLYVQTGKLYNDSVRIKNNNYLILNTLQPKQKTRENVISAHARLDNLYKVFSGKVKLGKMDIETYVQRYYLERILNAANIRFDKMSAGQFELRMVSDDKAGAGAVNKGLDLMVYSNITGKEREIRTLSGGESFMAALALALGMADQIQASSASINLDMMFIDEGFGSLDEHSRAQAVNVLKTMAGNSKMIGIISHVTELKQEIDDQLVVTKNERGSSVRWQIS